MLDGTILNAPDTVFVYDGTYNGLLSAVFDAVYSRTEPADIVPQNEIQLTFNSKYVEVTTDKEKSARVYSAAKNKLGKDAMHRIFYAFLSCGEHKELCIYRYLRLGFKMGSAANSFLTDKGVFSVSTFAQNVSRETDKMKGFMRFSVMEGGVQYCKFSPENNILPLVLPHFAARFPTIPFVIHDCSHSLLGIYDTKAKYIVDAHGYIPPEKSVREKEFEQLWKMFYDTIAIKERKNTKLMKQMMPARYFRHVWEL